ncbi:transcriptional regulator, XRE family with cupin sensor [Geodermatophilus obscurus]|uniref:Transcriptional regulator, XRE family with cupin sensor n=1 Tax=Geodermatophilus obscurus TaxID=1861 RepID=A0A1M7UN62_9ACTN|nr:XRE family transcriptional regulator [Geodermatophilus obscurus]SHN84461.1 transcriptional regulator, XRE family with cupin sensor [Geodermatophilus obscurus]
MTTVVEDEATTDGVLTAVGPRLRALRQRRRLTLTQLSEETGVSVSTLSRLESGQRRPTLELLLPLARAHHVPLDELVGAPETGDPRVHLRPRAAAGGMTVVPLTRRPGGIQAFKMVYAPRTPAGEPELKTHEGYDWVYVLSGRLRLLLGEHDVVLGPGEVAEFDTRTPHWIGNPYGEPAEVLALFGPQGERMHVRARPRR